MQKKLMAVAVASALAMPAVALAQSVSVSGFMKVAVGNIKIKEPGAARAGLHDSENRLQDNSSRLIFNINEDIGGGLQGIAQIDMRLAGDNGSLAASGNTWAGLQSNTMGRLTFGRHDLHYGKSPSDLAGKGLLQFAAISLMDYTPVGSGSGATTPVGRGTRTVNVVRWDSPNWSGFTVTGAYSFNASGPESDLNSSIRKGYATNINLGYATKAFKVEWSNWNEKTDDTAAVNDTKGDVINAWMSMAGFKFGVAYHAKENTAGTNKAEATAWTIPVNWEAGPHAVHFHYTVADDAKYNGTKDDESGAKMTAIAYVYSLSKRTSMSLNWGQIKNDRNVAYRFFTDTNGDLSSNNAALNNGEDGTVVAFVFRHAF